MKTSLMCILIGTVQNLFCLFSEIEKLLLLWVNEKTSFQDQNILGIKDSWMVKPQL